MLIYSIPKLGTIDNSYWLIVNCYLRTPNSELLTPNPSLPPFAQEFVAEAATRPEIKLLLCALAPERDQETAETIRHLVRQAIDWEYLLKAACQHGVLPLLSQSLHASCPDAVPPPISSRLQAEFQANTLKNLFLTQELLKILALCQKHQIPVLPYKGPVLAALLYGNIALRTFCDLDILVRPEDFLRVKELLASQGYQPRHGVLSEAQEKAFYGSYFEYPLLRPADGVFVDLHQALAEEHFLFPLTVEELWERRTAFSLLGKSVCHLSPEDLLVILCMHGCKDSWQQLKWIGDVAALLSQHPQLNWQQVWQQGQTLHSQRRLTIGLLLAHELLAAPLPEAVGQKIQADSESQALARQIGGRLFADRDDSVPAVIFQKYLFHVRLMEGMRDKVQYSWRYAIALIRLNPRDWSWLSLPPAFSFLYYLIRPLRLLEKYGRKLIGLK